MRSGGTFWFTFEGGTASKRAAREAEAKLKGGVGMPAHSTVHGHSSGKLGRRHRIGAETSDVLLIAGGIGINPLFAIMCQYGQCLKEALEAHGSGGGGGGGGDAVLHWNTGENAPSSPPRLHLLYSVTSKAGELRTALNRFAGTLTIGSHPIVTLAPIQITQPSSPSSPSSPPPPAELAFEAEIRALAAAFPTCINVVFVVTDEEADPSVDDSVESGSVRTVHGRVVDSAMITDVLGSGGGGSGESDESGGSGSGSAISLLCGPPGMIEAMEEECVACGIDRDRVQYEKWW